MVGSHGDHPFQEGNVLNWTGAHRSGFGAGVTTNYCFDAAGNLIHSVTAPATCPASGPYQYTYNAENQVTTTSGVTYTYDGDGKRLEKSNGRLYWYGTGSDPLDETDLAGNTNNASFFEYVFFGGKRIARRDSANLRRQIHRQ